MSNLSNHAPLTTANLNAYISSSETPSDNGDTILRAAREFGLDMPGGWHNSQVSSQFPMDQYLNGRDDPYAVSVVEGRKGTLGNEGHNKL